MHAEAAAVDNGAVSSSTEQSEASPISNLQQLIEGLERR